MGEIVYNVLSSERESLRKLLIEKSVKTSDELIFTLSSGKKSNFYVDCKMTTLLSQGLILIGNIIFNMISTSNIKAIGGLTLGADPISISTAIIAGQNGMNIVPFIVRKEPKKHGMMKWIEGDVQYGFKVVIVDDVVTTGESVIQAIEKAEESNLEIAGIIVLIDRDEGGREKIMERGYNFKSIFTKYELLKE